jgi:hypothetical protein
VPVNANKTIATPAAATTGAACREICNAFTADPPKSSRTATENNPPINYPHAAWRINQTFPISCSTASQENCPNQGKQPQNNRPRLRHCPAMHGTFRVQALLDGESQGGAKAALPDDSIVNDIPLNDLSADPSRSGA